MSSPPEKPEFDIQLQFAKGLFNFYYAQLFVTPPRPSGSFAGQTVIVTGANVGLGLEAARHFYRLGCARLVLAVRTVAKGEAAKEDIVRSAPTRSDGADAIAVWPLDLASTPSTLDFAARVRAELPRLDILVENAGIVQKRWVLAEGFESTIQVNVLNTFLLALELLPSLDKTKAEFSDASPRLVVVSSDAHRMTRLAEINAASVYDKLNDQLCWNGEERYAVSKLLEVLFVREMVARLNEARDDSPPPTVITLVHPGLCKSTFDYRDGQTPSLSLRLMRWLMERTTEVGGRTLVLGATTGPDAHGEYIADGKTTDVESWIYQDVGRRAQRKVFEQTMAILEQRKPGIAATARL
ncbi:NAD(P)-binding protein [Colletotrichum somersetense]|nr:NAD(P)-binding protein [Colletotrichum somersetense]